MSALLQTIAGLQLEAVSVIKDATTPQGFMRRVEAMGYDVAIGDQIESAIELGQDTLDTIEDLAVALLYDAPSLDELPGLIEQVADLIDSFRNFPQPSNSGSLGYPFDQTSFWADFGAYLVDEMIREMLRRNAPALKLLLFAIGVVKVEDVADASTGRKGYLEKIDFGAFGDFLSDPDGVLTSRFGLASNIWTGPEAAFFVRHLNDLGIGVRPRKLTAAQAAAITSMTADRGDLLYEIQLMRGVILGTGTRSEAGLRLLPRPGSSELGIGLYASPELQGGEIDITQDWKIALSVESDDVILGALTPSGLAKEPAAVTVRAVLSNESPEPTLIVGEADGSRVDLQSFEIETALLFDGSDFEAQLRLALHQLAIEIVAENSFLSEIMGDAFGTELDLEIAWSSQTGVTFGGSAGFNFTLPAEIRIGPITLTEVAIEISAANGTPKAQATAGVLGEFGPFDVRVGDMGLELKLEEDPDGKGLIGPYNLKAGLVPPSEFAFSIDLPAVRGGGLIDIDATRYSGSLVVDVISVGIAAITVIDTALPADPDGFAFFASLSLQFPAIPLGFGFSLSGVGGLVAINRSMDTIAIAEGLKNGALDTLLFPEDPVRDAPQLISMIDDYFPVLEGNSVFGPIVEIGWGAPKTLITMQLGVIISLPEGRIALLGSIAAILPKPDAPILSLKMDLLGEIDIPGGTLFMMASLYDSNLLSTIELSGDMGTYLATKGQPYFLMSVGGSHPGFEPPSLVPSVLHDLRRMRAGISVAQNVDISITTYFAVTSNTVQFGAAVALEMSVKIALTTYYARGEFGFDVLLQFDPFAIIADMYASVGVYSGNKELMGVHLSAHLEGPKPWYASGIASFKFFGIKINFSVEVGSKAPGESKQRIALRDDLMTALNSRESWRELPPAAAIMSGITFMDLEPDPSEDADRIWVRPDHNVAVSQGIVPLNKQIEVVGQGLPEAGEDYFPITGAGLGGLAIAYEEVDDFFAPAKFENLSRKDKLERSSFEEMTAGVSFGSAIAATTAHPDELANSSTNEYEEKWWEPEAERNVSFTADLMLRGLTGGSAARALNRKMPRAVPKFSVEPVQFVVADEISGEIATTLAGGADTGSQHAARAASSSARDAVVVSAASLAPSL